MNNYFHIALGDSAKGSLKEYFRKHKDNKYYGEIRNFREDLSTGSIYKLEQNIDKRVEWFKQMFTVTSNLEFLQDDLVDRKIKQTYNLELDIPKADKIIIWHGDNVIEQTALRYLVSNFKNNEIYEVSVSKSIAKEFDGERYKVRATAECSPEELGRALKNICLIDENRKEKLIAEWNELKKSKATLRILENKKIINVNGNYYDKDILQYTTNDFMMAAKVIGTVMGRTEQVVGDTFIDYRVRELIAKRKLEYGGKLESMRDFEIKLA